MVPFARNDTPLFTDALLDISRSGNIIVKIVEKKEKNMKIFRKSATGFTLIELIFEIFVLTFMLISAVILLGSLALNVTKEEINYIATDLCKQKAEETLSTYSFANVVASANTFAVPYQDYAYTVVVQDSPFEANQDNYKMAVVTVAHANIPPAIVYILFVKEIK